MKSITKKKVKKPEVSVKIKSTMKKTGDPGRHLLSDVAVDKEFEMELRKEERNELLQRLASQVLAGAEQVGLGPGPLCHQHVGVVAGVLVRLLGPGHRQNTKDK